MGVALFYVGALHAQSDDAHRAMASIVGLDVMSADIVRWCSSRAPASGVPLRAAWQAWRSANAVDEITRRLDADMLRRTREGMDSVIASTRHQLSRLGHSSSVCPQVVSMWSSDAFDVRRAYPAAYAPSPAMADSTVGRAAPATKAPPSAAGTSYEFQQRDDQVSHQASGSKSRAVSPPHGMPISD